MRHSTASLGIIGGFELMLIFTLKIKLGSGIYCSNDWECDIEIPENFILEDFHLFLQDLLSFDNDHMYEFYIANSVRGVPLSRFECDDKMIDEINISDFILKAKGKKAFYLFDYGDSWLFQISKSRKKPFQATTGIKYPRVISETGVKPEQYPEWEE